MYFKAKQFATILLTLGLGLRCTYLPTFIATLYNVMYYLQISPLTLKYCLSICQIFFYGLENNHIVATDKTCQVAKSFLSIPKVHSSDRFMLLNDRFTYVRIR